ncbi:DNA-binding transcriptional regulator, LysR family [Alkalispirochaeta americana]|uniref:DNA-binding transcriptional regulator, LysR family n=1 Tax=Alkalispirochaeta americana TaxID=159291 RepID=A0A1N6WA90_9SPIO|nr:LysR family transcriptional regulator [Alkalispirochaeta americana]SIQ87069.1 DNA-binding transcriptional regulator, LysR family [Alkalispirochaeta americana]
MDVIKLKAFCTVAALRSISKAAEVLYYTQPAVSAQIRELENAYGARLFRRVGQQLDLTVAGEALLPQATQLLETFELSRQVVADTVEQAQKTVTLGASTMPVTHLVPELIASFQRSHPGITVSLVTGSAAQIEHMIITGDVDVGILGRTGATRGKVRFIQHDLLYDPLVVVAGSSHPWAEAEKPPSLKEIGQERYVLPPANTLTRRFVEKWFRRHGLHLDVAYELINTEAIKRMVMQGHGVTILGNLVVAQEVEAGWLRKIPCEPLDIGRTICLVHQQESELPSAVCDFCNFVTEQYG